MILSNQEFNAIRKWVYCNARQIEISLWQFFYENGSVDNVLNALAYYQNEDGGFGHALEADSWNPNSSPYTTLFAIKLLKNINYFDLHHSIYQGVFRFLESGIYYDDDYWMFSIPTNDEYAHAPWWTYSKDANKFESIGLSAELAAFVLEYYNSNTDLYGKAMHTAKVVINEMISSKNHGEMGLGGYIVLINKMKELGIEGFDYGELENKLEQLVSSSIEHDTNKWKYHVVRPSLYIKSPDSPYYETNKSIIEKELDYLIDTKSDNDVWGITWSWFDNNDIYPKEFAISENWWKSFCAMEKLNFLKNFNRLAI